jgi:hypothetical protein
MRTVPRKSGGREAVPERGKDGLVLATGSDYMVPVDISGRLTRSAILRVC